MHSGNILVFSLLLKLLYQVLHYSTGTNKYVVFRHNDNKDMAAIRPTLGLAAAGSLYHPSRQLCPSFLHFQDLSHQYRLEYSIDKCALIGIGKNY